MCGLRTVCMSRSCFGDNDFEQVGAVSNLCLVCHCLPRAGT